MIREIEGQLTDVNLAIAAIGGEKWDMWECRCDHDVGFICEYCAIHDALISTKSFLKDIKKGRDNFEKFLKDRGMLKGLTL